MQTLAQQATHSGYQLTQIRRSGEWAIFQAQKPNHVNPHHWEVVRIRYKPSETILGKFIPDREVYPNSEAWGTDGFTCDTIERAYSKLNQLSGCHS